jgi:hypothetical protein
VLRETDPQASRTLWEALLPEEARQLPAELAAVDAYLDDERFLVPWETLFDRRLGRRWPPGRRSPLPAAVVWPLLGPAPAPGQPGTGGRQLGAAFDHHEREPGAADQQQVDQRVLA